MRRLIDLAYAARRRLWALLKVETHGVKLLVHDPAGRVLLVRHRYGRDHWMLPGGGVKRGEQPIDAAVRELREETALEAASPILFARYRSNAEGRRDTIDLFVTQSAGVPAPDDVELAEARFFALDDLPASTSPATARRVAEWCGTRTIDGVW